MTKYLIYASEGMYQDIAHFKIVSTDDINEAFHIAEDMSRSIIEDNYCDEYEGETWGETEFNLECGVKYDLFKLRSDANISEEEINKDNIFSIIKEYCEELR